MNGYYGQVKDIDLALYRGAYKIKDIYLHKVDTVTSQETEFFEAKLIDLSIQWEALFDGKIVGELEFQDARLRFTKDKAEPGEIKNDTNDFRKLLKDFMPLKVNRFEVINGVIQYIDEGSKPPVDIQMDNTHIIAENLKTEKDESLLPATVFAEANVYQGHLTVNMKLDPFAKLPTFDMNAELKETHLPDLNNFFKAYAKIDVNKGIFGLYTEIASKQGKFVGYVKPIIKDLDILGIEDRKDNILQKAWESITGLAGQALKNQRYDQVATKVPLKGTLDDTQANIWYAVMEVLKNAFIQAIQPSIDQEINISSVNAEQGEIKLDGEGEKEKKEEKKGILNKLFNKKDKEKDTEEKK
jgi:hypothetical protein